MSRLTDAEHVGGCNAGCRGDDHLLLGIAPRDLWELANSWDGKEDAGISHVVACQDFECKTCVVVACATDLRATLARPTDEATT